jgi:hypothetical protein
MKTKYFLVVLTVAAFFISCKSSTEVKTESDTTTVSQVNETVVTETASVKKYGIKSGIVTFEITMMDTKQKLVLYFDDFGTREAEERQNMYNIRPADKVAFTSGTCYRGIAYRFAWDEISEEDRNTKAKKLPNMTVAGKDCESFSYDMGSTSTVYAGWKNICLYQKTKSEYGDVIRQATKIEENATIPADKFQVPSGYEIKKAGF